MAFRLVNREKLLAPHRCILCERTPQKRVVDTGYNLIRGVPVSAHMRGRKYVCDTCGEHLSKAFGYLPHAQAAALKEEVIALQNRNVELSEQVDLGDKIDDLRSYLRGEVNATPEATVEDENDSPA
jgi:hypothetical protein